MTNADYLAGNIFLNIYFRNRDAERDRKRPSEEGGIFETHFRPVFKKIPDDQEVREGSTVRFDCLVNGRPIPELTWYRDGIKVNSDDLHKVRLIFIVRLCILRQNVIWYNIEYVHVMMSLLS